MFLKKSDSNVSKTFSYKNLKLIGPSFKSLGIGKVHPRLIKSLARSPIP
jgi:hypothetical protein